jgi:D-glycero-D-manno-heptose 1,7-bisphosphate phosphatase
VSSAIQGRVVILDRDGTIVVDHGYLADPARLEFLPRAVEGLRLMQATGARLVVVTNQSGVGRGLISLQRMHEINARFLEMVREIGARIEGLYWCPHRPEEECVCRKPRTRLVLDAAAELGFDPRSAWVIGDKSSDIELGRRLGAVTVLVSANGSGGSGVNVDADYVVPDLFEAAQLCAAARSSDPGPWRCDSAG